MLEKNLKKLKAKKHRVTNGFNTGTRDMKSKKVYQRKKRWSAEDDDHFLLLSPISQVIRTNVLIKQPNCG